MELPNITVVENSKTTADVDRTMKLAEAYLAHRPIPIEDLPRLLATIHSAVKQLNEPEPELTVATKPVPAVAIKKSVTPDYIYCLEDGLAFRSMKRHLMSKYGMTPDEYRAKWGLPSDYPITAANYALKRSQLAKKMGLGKKGKSNG